MGRSKTFVLLASLLVIVGASVVFLAITDQINPGSTTPRTCDTSNDSSSSCAPTRTTIIPGPPNPLASSLYSAPASCSTLNGVCITVIENNSTTPLMVEGCQVQVTISSGNSTVVTVAVVNGTVGGPGVVNGIPARSEATATCTIPIQQTSGQQYASLPPSGTVAGGTFLVKLVDGAYSYPAGSETNVEFQGVWS